MCLLNPQLTVFSKRQEEMKAGVSEHYFWFSVFVLTKDYMWSRVLNMLLMSQHNADMVNHFIGLLFSTKYVKVVTFDVCSIGRAVLLIR